MKILYDHQIFQMQSFGGISRYFHELFSQIQEEKDVEIELSLLYSNNVYIDKYSNIKKRFTKGDQFQKSFGGKHFYGKYFLYKLLYEKKDEIPNFDLLNKENTINKLKEGNFDVFHATYYDDYFLEYIGEKPYVITVHDLIHQIYPEYFLGNKIDKNKKLLENAAGIIAISETTKKDLKIYFDIPEDKIQVIYHASSLLKNNDSHEQFISKIPQNFLLFVGSRAIYKNFYFLVEAFAKISDEYPNLFLICTGSGFSATEIDFFERLNIKDKILHFFVNDNELIYLYQNALCFVFPSLYEGFGIPILEAYENKCCTLLSNTSSLKEVGQDGALYFEPKNFDSLIHNLKKIITDKKLRIELINKGAEIHKKYSWKKSSTETLNFYKKIIKDI